MAEIRLDLFVPGIPRPKGSLDAYTRTNGTLGQKENNVHSSPWLDRVAGECRAVVADRAGRPGAWLFHDGFPIDVPVVVTLVFLFPRPKKSRFPVPATTATGDIDKLCRNVLDALTQAKVIADDSLVCDLVAKSRYVAELSSVGVGITVAHLFESSELEQMGGGL